MHGNFSLVYRNFVCFRAFYAHDPERKRSDEPTSDKRRERRDVFEVRSLTERL
jgi:hypothetical protein